MCHIQSCSMQKNNGRYLPTYSSDGSTRREVRPEVHLGPISRKRGRRGSIMVPFERAMLVSYWLSIVIIALYLYHSAAIYHRISPTLKSTGGSHFGKNL